MLNHITIMGRLVRDPELRHTQSGIPVCSFSIACERAYKDSDGNKPVDYLDVVSWRNCASFVSKYLSKGRMAVVDGRLQLRDWTDREGNKRRSAEILANSVHFGDSRPQQQNQSAPGPAPAPAGTYAGGGYSEDDLDAGGDLPF